MVPSQKNSTVGLKLQVDPQHLSLSIRWRPGSPLLRRCYGGLTNTTCDDVRIKDAKCSIISDAVHKQIPSNHLANLHASTSLNSKTTPWISRDPTMNSESYTANPKS